MKYKKWIPVDPMEDLKEQSKARASVGGSNDYYGACSLEHFSSASGLGLTHEDAQGFLDYPTSFPNRSANFWFRDSGVKVWKYEEAYDNWQDTYGMDAVMAFYHSGHGNMDGAGVFQAPLGGVWDGRDWAFSNRMAFSNEELRYLFWSTCFSLRVKSPHSPIRTWAAPNKGGLRMLFGYETTSVDDPNYGKYFWQEWKKGKTFARSFLDASWRISHAQIPVVMASGSNQADAVNRLNNERYFTKVRAAKGWYQWIWVEASRDRAPQYSAAIPNSASALILGNRFRDEELPVIASRSGISSRYAGSIAFDDAGNKFISSKDVQVCLNVEGALNIHFGKPNFLNTEALSSSKALKIAKERIDDLGFTKNIDLVAGNMRQVMTCGYDSGRGNREEKEYPVETIVQFRQTAGGLSSVNSDHGLITVAIDNDGKITNVYNSTRAVLGETEKPKSIITPPPEKVKSKEADSNDKFTKKIERIMSKLGVTDTSRSSKVNILIEKAGYDLSGNMGIVVLQRDVEVNIGNDLLKRYKIRVPVMG